MQNIKPVCIENEEKKIKYTFKKLDWMANTNKGYTLTS